MFDKIDKARLRVAFRDAAAVFFGVTQLIVVAALCIAIGGIIATVSVPLFFVLLLILAFVFIMFTSYKQGGL